MDGWVLLVEDDVVLGRRIVDLLAPRYRTRWIQRGDTALTANLREVRLVVLDLTLPGADGFAVLAALRAQADVPIVVLSARTAADDRVRALRAGADDYVTKPFWPDELLARMEARLRRPSLDLEQVVTVGPLRIELEGRSVSVDGVPCELTRAEFELLATLARRNAPVSRRKLGRAVLDADRGASDRTLDVHVSRLRRKLGPAAAHLRTVRGIGYQLCR